MLALEGIKKFYGKVLALDSLSLTVNDGSLFGFVGPNGAGKTTAIKIMTGILHPDEGSISIDGENITERPERLREMTGYVPDSFGIYRNLKVSEYMEFFTQIKGITGLEARKRIETLLSYVELSDKEDFYVEALSRGMKQRLSLARALIPDPPVLILDEPTQGLDPRTRYEFKQIIGELSDKGKTIIISSHILSDISELCTDIAIIDQGKIAAQGKLLEVMRLVTAENPVVISLLSDINGAAAFLREQPLVASVMVKRNDIMINFTGTEKEEAALLKDMISEGFKIRSFSREQGSLEALFMQLTGHGEERVISSSEDYEY